MDQNFFNMNKTFDSNGNIKQKTPSDNTELKGFVGNQIDPGGVIASLPQNQSGTDKLEHITPVLSEKLEIEDLEAASVYLKEEIEKIRNEVAQLNTMTKSPEAIQYTRNQAKQKLKAWPSRIITGLWSGLIVSRNYLQEWFQKKEDQRQVNQKEGNQNKELLKKTVIESYQAQVGHENEKRLIEVTNNHRIINQMENALHSYDKIVDKIRFNKNQIAKNLEQINSKQAVIQQLQETESNSSQLASANQDIVRLYEFDIQTNQEIDNLNEELNTLDINTRLKELNLLYDKIDQDSPGYMQGQGQDSRLHKLVEETYGLFTLWEKEGLVVPTDEPDTEFVDEVDLGDITNANEKEVGGAGAIEAVKDPESKEIETSELTGDGLEEIEIGDDYIEFDEISIYEGDLARDFEIADSERYEKYISIFRNAVSHFGYYASRQQIQADEENMADFLRDRASIENEEADFEASLFILIIPAYIKKTVEDTIGRGEREEILSISASILTDYETYTQPNENLNRIADLIDSQGLESVSKVDLDTLLVAIYKAKLDKEYQGRLKTNFGGGDYGGETTTIEDSNVYPKIINRSINNSAFIAQQEGVVVKDEDSIIFKNDNGNEVKLEIVKGVLNTKAIQDLPYFNHRRDSSASGVTDAQVISFSLHKESPLITIQIRDGELYRINSTSIYEDDEQVYLTIEQDEYNSEAKKPIHLEHQKSKQTIEANAHYKANLKEGQTLEITNNTTRETIQIPYLDNGVFDLQDLNKLVKAGQTNKFEKVKNKVSCQLQLGEDSHSLILEIHNNEVDLRSGQDGNNGVLEVGII